MGGLGCFSIVNCKYAMSSGIIEVAIFFSVLM